MGFAPVKRAFKFRFYPTAGQAAELERTFGSVRKVYNLALQARTAAQACGERIGYGQTSAMLTAWKRTEELAYLSEVSSVPLQQALRHLQTAFVNFWAKRADHPRFKSRKRSRASAEYTRSGFVLRGQVLTLAKMREPLRIVWSRPLPEDCQPSTVTVTRDAAGRWFVSLLCEDATVHPLPETDGAIGIDVGLHHLLTLSTGEKVENPRHERRDRQRLARAQRRLARKKGNSANREKARRKVARVYVRIADRRRDGLQKLTTRLVRENQTLVIEDLAVGNMVGNHCLARAISDAAWREFRAMLEYKAAWYGRRLIAIDRWYPSSKRCSACGTVVAELALGTRTWTCDSCGVSHDRDINAAKNILAAGRAVAVCGDGVRPQRSAPGGQSSMKQKSRSVRVGDLLPFTGGEPVNLQGYPSNQTA
ncbi:RNA-guided endonuclease InsQ/TnpB family protein [Nocardia heshunensis]